LRKDPAQKKLSNELDISDKDIYEAMKNIPGYLDITPGDFKEIYSHAYNQALRRITQSKNAIDIMTREVVAVEKDTPLKLVAKLMAEKGVSGVPVLDRDRHVAGVISEKDFLFRMGGKDAGSFMGVVATCLKGKGCVALSIREKRAEDIMTSPAVTVTEDTILMDIANVIIENNINRVPVVDRDNKLVGIVTRGDVVEAQLLKG
jgi:CBS domain-containing membrane protein